MRAGILIFFVSIVTFQLSAQVKFNEIYLFPEGKSSGVERFIEIKNHGLSNVDISGYHICSSSKINSGEKVCSNLKSHATKGLNLGPGELRFLKINRHQLQDNFVYLQVPHDAKNAFFLLDHRGVVIDEIDISGKDRSKSISKIGEDTWSVTLPTKGKRNKYSESTKFTYETSKKLDNRELNWGVSDTLIDSNLNEEFRLDLDSVARGKIFINEVFFVHKPDGYIKKDFWLELVNASNKHVDISNLKLTTDTIYGLSKLKFHASFEEGYELPPGEHIIINLSNEYNTRNEASAVLMDKSATISLMQNDELIDSVTIKSLGLHQSYSRLPDALGEFMVVNVKTPEKSNDQLLPAYNTISKLTLYHSIGLSFTDYNTLNQTNVTSYRPGFDLSFGWERPKKRWLTRYNFGYSRQNSSIMIDSTTTTPFGQIFIETSGKSKMDYFKFKFEAGVSLMPKVNLFLGTGSGVLLRQFTEADQTLTSVLDATGERFEQKNRIENVNAFRVDDLDFDLSLGLEYQINKSAYVNLSYSRDYFSLNTAREDLGVPNFKTVNHFLLRFILPLYRSHKLREKAFLIKTKPSLGYNL